MHSAEQLACDDRGHARMTGFRLWLWTMLAVIALSAAPSGGPLRMQIIGRTETPR